MAVSRAAFCRVVTSVCKVKPVFSSTGLLVFLNCVFLNWFVMYGSASPLSIQKSFFEI